MCVYFQHAQRHLTRKPEFVNVPERLKEGKANFLNLAYSVVGFMGSVQEPKFWKYLDQNLLTMYTTSRSWPVKF